MVAPVTNNNTPPLFADDKTCNTAEHSTCHSDLLIRTSWTDAAVALAQIDKGKADGQRTALWVRARLQAYLFALGCFLHRHAGKVIFIAFLVLLTFCVGLKSTNVVTKVEELWVEEGGRLEKELRYTAKALGEASGSTHEMLIQTPKDPGASLLHVDALLTHLEVVKAATMVEVHLFDTAWRLKDICYSPNIPNFDVHYIDQIFENIIPCAIITPLDCFWEGSKLLGPQYSVTVPGIDFRLKWTNLNPLELVEKMKEFNYNFPFQTLEDNLKRAGVTTGYQEKPCLVPSDPECPSTAPNKASRKEPDIGAELTGGCYGFAAKYMHWPEDLVVGGTRKNKTQHLTRAGALQTVVQLMGERELFEFHSDSYKVHHVDWTQDKAAQVLQRWQTQFAEVVRKTLNSRYNVHAFSTATLNDILSQFSELRIPNVAIGFTVIASYVALILYRPWDPLRSQSGVGVAGVIMLAMTVPSGLGFCALLGIAFNATTMLIIPFITLGLGVINMLLILDSYADANCDARLDEQTGVVLKKCGHSVLTTALAQMCAFFAAALIAIPALRVFALQAAVLFLFNLAVTLLVFPAMVSVDLRRRESVRKDILCCFHAPTTRKPAPSWCLRSLITNHYAPFLMRPGVRATAVVIQVVVLGASVWGALRVRDGLDLKEVVPQNTSEHAFLTAQSDLFGFYNMYAVTRGEFEYPTNQRLLYEYHEAFMRVSNVMKNDNGGLQTFWLAMFRDWLEGLQKAFDKDWQRGAITQERWFTNATDEGILAYKLLVQTGHVDNPVDKSQVWQDRLVDNNGIINPKGFYNYLSAWSWNDALAYGFSQANLRPEPREWHHVAGDFDLKIPKSGPLVYTQLPFYLHHLRDTPQIMELIAQVRSICDRFEERGLPNFPSGIPFLFWEQYLGLRKSLLLALTVALAAVFLLVAGLLLNLWAALMATLSLATIVLQLLGLMGAAGIHLSAVSAVLLIVAVGIGVNFMVHISLGFVTSVGGKKRRLELALEQMFRTVFHGGIVSLIAIAMLASSEFDFIVRYFFLDLVALVIIGLLQGLVLFPVLLSLVGPDAEVVGIEYTDRIATPSPEPITKRSGGVRVSKAPPRPRTCRLHKDSSLTTITEEPSWHSSVQSIVVQPELVVTTSSDSSPDPPRVTKVTATAKLKVEVHSTKGKSRRREFRDSISSDGSDKT